MTTKIPKSLLPAILLLVSVSLLLAILLKPSSNNESSIFVALSDQANPGFIVYRVSEQSGEIECTRQLSRFGNNLSPNGQISLWLYVTTSRQGEIHIFRNNSDCFANSSETEQTILLNDNGNSGGSAWSPDSRYVGFSVNRSRDNSGIYLFDVVSQQLQLLLEVPFSTLDFQWAPNGRQFMFISSRELVFNIYVVDADGSNLLLLGNVTPGFPKQSWSNDSTRILVGTPGLNGPGNLYLFQSDGSGQQFLGSVIGNITNIAWSPDDTQVLVVGSPWGGSLDTVYLMNNDGSDLHPILRIEEYIFQMLWLPTGEEFIFLAGIPNASIYVANISGSQNTLVALTGFPMRDMLVLIP